MADGLIDKVKDSLGIGSKLDTKQLVTIGLIALFVLFLINAGALNLQDRNTLLFIAIAAIIIYILFQKAKGPQFMMMDEATKVAKQWIRFFQRQSNSVIPLGVIKVKAAAKLKKMRGKADRYECSFEINRRTYIVHVDPWNGNCLLIRTSVSGYDPKESPDLDVVDVLIR